MECFKTEKGLRIERSIFVYERSPSLSYLMAPAQWPFSNYNVLFKELDENVGALQYQVSGLCTASVPYDMNEWDSDKDRFAGQGVDMR